MGYDCRSVDDSGQGVDNATLAAYDDVGFFAKNLLIGASFPYGTAITSTLDRFDAATSIEGSLYVERNTELATLGGFSRLAVIGGRVFIDNNAKLDTIEGKRFEETCHLAGLFPFVFFFLVGCLANH